MSRRLSKAVAVGLVGLVTPLAVHASASFSGVWFPYGNVNFFIANDAVGARTTILDTMNYLSAHTPLDIAEVATEGASNLQFEATWASPNGGGYTYGYWDEVRDDQHQKIRFDPNYLPGRSTLVHEFGHALGRPHEFQRDDRDEHVSVCDNLDPFNYAKLGSVYWPDPYYNLSPYDFASSMNGGYSDCVIPLAGQEQQSRSYDGVTNLLSVHDINGIYRMYGEKLGANDAGDRFGVAVASGDYDDDGFKDVAVATLQTGGLWLSFYRGVATAPSENVTGLKWMPWFKVQHDSDVPATAQVTLVTGDFNGDGIDDLALGQPDYNGNDGRVSLLFVNSLPSDPAKDSFAEDFAPWGRKGIQYRIDIAPGNVGLLGGLMASPRFGASLAALRGTSYRANDTTVTYHDLVIGAPLARLNGLSGTPSKGAVVIVKGSHDNSPSDFSVATYTTLWNPSNTTGEFGAAVSGIPGLCALSGHGEEYYNDFLSVGAPGHDANKGAVHVYGCATSGYGNTLSAPSLLSSYYAAATAARYGHALTGFRIRSGISARTSYLAIGQPKYSNGSLVVGRVALDSFSTAGVRTYVTSYVPSTVSGNDEFGYALAVQQRSYSDTIDDEGGRQTYIGIGMPGTEVNGIQAGKVYVWRPFNSDGTLNNSASVVNAYNPNASTDTGFGRSIAALRPLKDLGGFVAGAPDAITADDNVQAGQVSVLQNDGADYTWVPSRQNLNQETEGDRLATNR
ncbi:MAG TPA: M12 family metallopeptidase [Archangium sp.]|jgi:hypothetical protein|uniref:M12 family metallopeptidase n=1 Tax=Archangium sp. TaxID=1872627 RepID=UPI002ED77AA2